MIALTVALYVTVYAALIVAYVSVVKYMAEKPVAMPGDAAPAAARSGVVA
jgi:cytochrome bd ubiquinol oxidase subunit I